MKPDPLFLQCLCWWQMVMLSWWICYLPHDMQYVCILTVRGETPAVPPVIDSKELFSLLTELRSISIILATRRGFFIIMFIIWEKPLWCKTLSFFFFFFCNFAPAPAPPTPPSNRRMPLQKNTRKQNWIWSTPSKMNCVSLLLTQQQHPPPLPPRFLKSNGGRQGYFWDCES